MTTDIEGVLGADASLLDHKCSGMPQDLLHLPGPDFVDRVWTRDRTAARGAAQPAALFDHGRLGGHRLPVDPARRPGHRALGGGVVRAQPALLRPGEHRRAGDRGRLQRASPRRSACWARCRASYAHKIPFIVEAQPQRAAHLPEPVTTRSMFATVRAGLRHGRGRRRRHHLLRVATESARQIQEVGRGLRSRPTSWAWSRSCGATCATRVQERRRRLPRRGRPDRAGQPPRRHHRGRHHQAEAAREQRRLQRAVDFGKTSPAGLRASSSTDHPIDLCRWQVANCYMGRVGLINSGGAVEGRDRPAPTRCGPR